MTESLGPFAVLFGVPVFLYMLDKRKRNKQVRTLWKNYIIALYTYNEREIAQAAKSFCAVNFPGEDWQAQINNYITRADYLRSRYYPDGSLRK